MRAFILGANFVIAYKSLDWFASMYGLLSIQVLDRFKEPAGVVIKIESIRT